VFVLWWKCVFAVVGVSLCCVGFVFVLCCVCVCAVVSVCV